MEMPKGWLEFYNVTLLFFELQTQYWKRQKLIETNQMLKEMAEALEKIYGEDGVIPYDLPVLKKFREWK